MFETFTCMFLIQLGFDPSNSITRSGLDVIRSEKKFSIHSDFGPPRPQQAVLVRLFPKLIKIIFNSILVKDKYVLSIEAKHEIISQKKLLSNQFSIALANSVPTFLKTYTATNIQTHPHSYSYSLCLSLSLTQRHTTKPLEGKEETRELDKNVLLSSLVFLDFFKFQFYQHPPFHLAGNPRLPVY